MRVSQVTVSLQKRVNDGDYGSEMAEAQYVVLIDEGEDPDEVVATMLRRARGQVLSELGASTNASVLRRLNPPQQVYPTITNRINPAGFEDDLDADSSTEEELAEAIVSDGGGGRLPAVDDDGEVEHVDAIASAKGNMDDF